MPEFIYPFVFPEDDRLQIRGSLELEKPLPYSQKNGGSGFYRPARIVLDNGIDLELVLYHNDATAEFIYLRTCKKDANLLEIIGLFREEIQAIHTLTLPGQLYMGSARSRLIAQAVNEVFYAPPLSQSIAAYRQHHLAVFPIAREGLKYQVAEAIFENYGYYCDEVVLDAHHVFDSSVPLYNRKVEFTIFKDKDLDEHQRENIAVAFIADSIASGIVMREVIAKVKERFDHIQRVEVIAPFATLRGLSRIARLERGRHVATRVHVFETLLNALPPDFYYSAHFDIPEFHICPELETEYRRWWGEDSNGNAIADTACAGYGWSEVLFSPRRQIGMINSELGARHQMSIVDIVRRNI